MCIVNWAKGPPRLNIQPKLPTSGILQIVTSKEPSSGSYHNDSLSPHWKCQAFVLCNWCNVAYVIIEALGREQFTVYSLRYPDQNAISAQRIDLFIYFVLRNLLGHFCLASCLQVTSGSTKDDGAHLRELFDLEPVRLAWFRFDIAANVVLVEFDGNIHTIGCLRMSFPNKSMNLFYFCLYETRLLC